MEEKETNIIKDEKIKDFNEEESIIYKYLIEGENKQKFKTDLENKILDLKNLDESIPKIEEKEQNIVNNLVKNYFQEKEEEKENVNQNKIIEENNQNINIIYTFDHLLNEKEIIEKRIKDKKEAMDLLCELNNLVLSKKISQNLKEKINSNIYLCRNQELKNFISKINKNKNFQEKEDLTDEQKAICLFRNIIKSSFQDAKNNNIEETTILKFFQDLEFKNIDIQEIINENEGINSCKEEKIIDFKSNIIITPSFYIFLKEIHKYNPYNKNNKNYLNIFYKVINLLLNRYEFYYWNIEESNNKISILILIHNNLELFNCLINYYILFYGNNDNEKDKLNEAMNNSLINIVIKFKNLSLSIFSQVMADFTNDLILEMDTIETFENIHTETLFDFCIKKVQKTITMIFKFFDELRITAIHREVIFYFNDVLNKYFNSLNEKVLKVSNYYLDDIKALLNISQEILKNMKKNIEKISSHNIDLSIKFMNILEQNLSYLKFQEILFVLNSNLNQIQNYLINENNSIYISKDDLIKLLDTTFEPSDKLTELKAFINNNIKEKKQIKYI